MCWIGFSVGLFIGWIVGLAVDIWVIRHFHELYHFLTTGYFKNDNGSSK